MNHSDRIRTFMQTWYVGDRVAKLTPYMEGEVIKVYNGYVTVRFTDGSSATYGANNMISRVE